MKVREMMLWCCDGNWAGSYDLERSALGSPGHVYKDAEDEVSPRFFRVL